MYIGLFSALSDRKIVDLYKRFVNQIVEALSSLLEITQEVQKLFCLLDVWVPRDIILKLFRNLS